MPGLRLHSSLTVCQFAGSPHCDSFARAPLGHLVVRRSVGPLQSIAAVWPRQRSRRLQMSVPGNPLADRPAMQTQLRSVRPGAERGDRDLTRSCRIVIRNAKQFSSPLSATAERLDRFLRAEHRDADVGPTDHLTGEPSIRVVQTSRHCELEAQDCRRDRASFRAFAYSLPLPDCGKGQTLIISLYTLGRRLTSSAVFSISSSTIRPLMGGVSLVVSRSRSRRQDILSSERERVLL